jgi:hypothetical protein
MSNFVLHLLLVWRWFWLLRQSFCRFFAIPTCCVMRFCILLSAAIPWSTSPMFDQLTSAVVLLTPYSVANESEIVTAVTRSRAKFFLSTLLDTCRIHSTSHDDTWHENDRLDLFLAANVCLGSPRQFSMAVETSQSHSITLVLDSTTRVHHCQWIVV